MNPFSRPKAFHRYTASAKRVIFYAAQGALSRGASEIEPADLLLGLARDRHADDCAFRFLHERHEELATSVGLPWMPSPSHWPPLDKKNRPVLTPEGKQVLAFAKHEAETDGCYWVDTDHLQAGILRIDGDAAAALSRIGYTLENTRTQGKSARELWPEKKPSLRQRLSYQPLFVWIMIGFIAGLLVVNLFNLLHAH